MSGRVFGYPYFPAAKCLLAFTFLLGVLAPSTVAQLATDQEDADAYDLAVEQQMVQGRVTALEIFLEDHPNSPLKKDALEFLLYIYQQGERFDKAALAAYQLLEIDPGNVPALALQADAAEQRMTPERAEGRKKARALATRGLLALPRFTAPRGMSQSQFEDLRLQAKATLDSVFGFEALRSKDYLTAQTHLREAVRATPNQIDRVYSLALSYLRADPPNHQDGLWCLARAAHLANGTPFGSQVDRYGRNVYRTVYGSESGWQKLLVQTQVGSHPTSPAPSDKREKTVVLRVRVSLFDNNQISRGVPKLEIALRRLDSKTESDSRALVTDNSGASQVGLAPGRYQISTPHGISAGEKWFLWDLEVLAIEPQNYIELTNQNATIVSDAHTTPAVPDSPSQTTPQRPLQTYSTVIVKRFLVENNKETSEFPGGDEVLLQKVIVGKLHKETAFRTVIDAGDNQSKTAQPEWESRDAVTLSGTIVQYSSGNPIRRNVIGFMGGVTRLKVRFVIRDAETGEEVFHTELVGAGSPGFGGSSEQMRSQAILRIADSLIQETNRNR
jgi:tetratricopeptide (TPR) repeat protein